MKMNVYLNTFFNDDSMGFFDLSRIYRKLMILHENSTLKKIMVTSALSFEGKSTVATLLAVTIAKFNEQPTVIIDADFRKPRIHNFFDLPKQTGFAELIARQADIDHCCKETKFPNLKVMTCGEINNAFIGLLELVRIHEVLDQLQDRFHCVIVDCPPVMLVGDSVMFAKEMDGIVLVVKSGDTQREVARYAVDLLHGVGGRIIGVILNDHGRTLPYYYHPYYYKYYSKK